MPYEYGIDFGTSNSAIARWTGDTAELILIGDEPTMPSAVYDKAGGIDTAEFIVGTGALNNQLREPESVQVNFKLLMGLGDQASITFPTTGRTVSPIRLAAEILRALLAGAAQGRWGDTESSAVITIPAAATTEQVNATIQAAQLAGIRHCATYPEPLAASLAYTHAHRLPDGLWLVYDFGGGTFDAVLIEVVDGDPTLRLNRGERTTGGQRIDLAIVEHILLPALQASGYDLASLDGSGPVAVRARAALRRVAETAKQAVSYKPKYEVTQESLFRDANGEPVQLIATVTRDAVERLATPFIDQTIECCRAMLATAGIGSGDVNGILLVGGPTNMGFLRRRVIDSLKIRILDYGIDPMTAVATGAAIYAASLPSPPKQLVPTTGHVTLRMMPEAGQSPAPKLMVEMLPPADAAAVLDGATLSLEAVGAVVGWNSGARAIPATRRVLFDAVPAAGLVTHRFRPTVLTRDGLNLDVQPNLLTYTRSNAPATVLLHSVGVLRGDNQLDLFFEHQRPLPCEQQRSYRVRSLIRRGEDRTFELLFFEGDRARADRNRRIGQLRIDVAAITADLPSGSEILVGLRIDRNREMTAVARHPATNQVWTNVLQIGNLALPDRLALDESLAELRGRIETVTQVVAILGKQTQTAAEAAAIGRSVGDLDRHIDAIVEALGHAAYDMTSLLRADDQLREAHAVLDELSARADDTWTIASLYICEAILKPVFQAAGQEADAAGLAALMKRAEEDIRKQDREMIETDWRDMQALYRRAKGELQGAGITLAAAPGPSALFE